MVCLSLDSGRCRHEQLFAEVNRPQLTRYGDAVRLLARAVYRWRYYGFELRGSRVRSKLQLPNDGNVLPRVSFGPICNIGRARSRLLAAEA